MQRASAQGDQLDISAAGQALFEGAAQAIIAADRRGRMVAANSQALKIFGFQKAELAGTSLERLLPYRARPAYRSTWRRCFRTMKSGPAKVGIQLVMCRKDGGAFPAEIGISRVETPHGPLALAFVTDISSRQQAEAEIRRNQQELRALNARLISFQEESRKQLARELHDVLTREVAVLAADIEGLRQRWNEFTVAMESTLIDVQKGIKLLAENVHDVSRRLHPATLYELGLAAALETECLSFSRQHGVAASLRKDASVPKHVPDQAGLALYRIAQEAMRNAAQHAQARRVRVALRMHGGELILAVSDDGLGFDPDRARRKGGLGLISMEERARSVNGSFRANSRRGRGTDVEVRVPLSSASR